MTTPGRKVHEVCSYLWKESFGVASHDVLETLERRRKHQKVMAINLQKGLLPALKPTICLYILMIFVNISHDLK
jgi:hypothetical protein